MTYKTITEDDKQIAFDFLDALRDSGLVNMFESAPTLREHFEFEIDKHQAKALVLEWMESKR